MSVLIFYQGGSSIVEADDSLHVVNALKEAREKDLSFYTFPLRRPDLYGQYVSVDPQKVSAVIDVSS